MSGSQQESPHANLDYWTTLDGHTTLDQKGQEVESLPRDLVDFLGEQLAQALLQDIAEDLES